MPEIEDEVNSPVGLWRIFVTAEEYRETLIKNAHEEIKEYINYKLWQIAANPKEDL